MERRKHVLLVTNAVSDIEVSQIKQSLFTPQIVPISIKVSIVHVVPTLPTCYFNIPTMITLSDRYYQEARDNLERVGDALNVSKKDQWLMMGQVRTEVLRLANKLNIQFILANSANLIELRKTTVPANHESQRYVIDNVSELCAGL